MLAAGTDVNREIVDCHRNLFEDRMMLDKGTEENTESNASSRNTVFTTEPDVNTKVMFTEGTDVNTKMMFATGLDVNTKMMFAT